MTEFPMPLPFGRNVGDEPEGDWSLESDFPSYYASPQLDVKENFRQSAINNCRTCIITENKVTYVPICVAVE